MNSSLNTHSTTRYIKKKTKKLSLSVYTGYGYGWGMVVEVADLTTNKKKTPPSLSNLKLCWRRLIISQQSYLCDLPQGLVFSPPKLPRTATPLNFITVQISNKEDWLNKSSFNVWNFDCVNVIMDLWSDQRTTLGLIWVLPVWIKIGEGDGGKKLI